MMQIKNKTASPAATGKPFHLPGSDIRAVVFDCDGVMFDTAKTNAAFYNHLLRHFERPAMSDVQARFIQMHTVYESVHYLFGSDPLLEEKAHIYREALDYKPFIKEMEMEPDLISLLKCLRHNYNTGIATNRADSMTSILETFNLGRYFDIVVCALDVERPKPHPDALIRILDNLGLSPNQMMYIGDSDLDEKAAESAGVHFIAYRNRALSAEFYADRLGDVAECLGKSMDRENV